MVKGAGNEPEAVGPKACDEVRKAVMAMDSDSAAEDGVGGLERSDWEDFAEPGAEPTGG